MRLIYALLATILSINLAVAATPQWPDRGLFEHRPTTPPLYFMYTTVDCLDATCELGGGDGTITAIQIWNGTTWTITSGSGGVLAFECNTTNNPACVRDTGTIFPEVVPEDIAITLVEGHFTLASCLRKGQPSSSTVDGIGHCECAGCSPIPSISLISADRQMLIYGYDTGETACNTTARYFGGPNNDMTSGTSTDVVMPVTVPGIVRVIRIWRRDNVVVGVTETWTVQDDGVDTAATCSVAAGTRTASCLGFDVGIPDGNSLRLKRVCTGTDAVTRVVIAVAYEPQ